MAATADRSSRSGPSSRPGAGPRPERADMSAPPVPQASGAEPRPSAVACAAVPAADPNSDHSPNPPAEPSPAEPRPDEPEPSAGAEPKPSRVVPPPAEPKPSRAEPPPPTTPPMPNEENRPNVLDLLTLSSTTAACAPTSVPTC